MTIEHSRVPTFPKIIAITRGDGTGEVSVNGNPQSVSAESTDEVRAQIIKIIVGVASRLGRPVKVATTGVDGDWPLIIHPDGQVEEDTSAPPQPKQKPRKDKERKAGGAHSGAFSPPSGPSPSLSPDSSASTYAVEAETEPFAPEPVDVKAPAPSSGQAIPEAREAPPDSPAVRRPPWGEPPPNTIVPHLDTPVAAPDTPATPVSAVPSWTPPDPATRAEGRPPLTRDPDVDERSSGAAMSARWWEEVIVEHNRARGFSTVPEPFEGDDHSADAHPRRGFLRRLLRRRTAEELENQG